ncbi:MAG: hypothetical protein QM820_33080 [Minicystis sp.]
MSSDADLSSEPPVTNVITRRAPASGARRAVRVAISIVLGLALGLSGAEAAFHVRDHGAFPLVNVYEADAKRGVRLQPGAETKVESSDGRVTRVRVNGEGFRGPEWPAPSREEVLIVGDSITFGLGVDEEETLAAKLRAALGGAQVIDASVPTWGPPEYLITAQDLLARRKPGTVVVAINLINDFSEIDRPNTERHTEVDGWAARIDPRVPLPRPSRLRAAAVRRSHAAFALWRWQRTREAASFPESGLDALLRLADGVARAGKLMDGYRREQAEQKATQAATRAALDAIDGEIAALGKKYAAWASTWSPAAIQWHAWLRTLPFPEGALFEGNYGGCSPPPWPHGYLLPAEPKVPPEENRLGGLGLAGVGEGYGYGYFGRGDGRLALEQIKAVRALPVEVQRLFVDAFTRREAARKRYHEVRGATGDEWWYPDPPRQTTLPPYNAVPPRPMSSFLWSMFNLAHEHGAKLVVVPIPLDAQIDPSAQSRRGLTAEQVAALDALVADNAAMPGIIGTTGVDPTSALRSAATPYLPDGHLSAAGHEAVARAVAEVLKKR